MRLAIACRRQPRARTIARDPCHQAATGSAELQFRDSACENSVSCLHLRSRMRLKRPPRLDKFEYRGLYRYFLTICTENRVPAFADLAAARQVITHFLQSATRFGFAVSAYCAMPDHLHALLHGTRADADFKLFVRRWKQQSGFRWKRRTGKTLWQQGYFDRVLREEEPDLLVIAYIARNPIAAGFAAKPDDYPLFGSSRYTVEEIRRALAEYESRVPWSRN